MSKPSKETGSMDMVKIYTAADVVEADLIKSFLEEQDIKVFIKGYHHRSMLGLMGPYVGLDIMVSKTDEEEALKILNDNHNLAEDFSSKAEEEEPKATEDPSTKLRPRSIAVAVMLAIILPGLGSLYARKKNAGEWILTGTAVCYISLLVFISTADTAFHLLYSQSMLSVDILLVLSLVSLIITDMIIAVRGVRTQIKSRNV